MMFTTIRVSGVNRFRRLGVASLFLAGGMLAISPIVAASETEPAPAESQSVRPAMIMRPNTPTDSAPRTSEQMTEQARKDLVERTGETWNAQRAIKALLEDLAIPEDFHTSRQAHDQRQARIHAWWNRFQKEKIDLGSESYLSAMPRYFTGDRQGAVEQLTAYILEHGKLTAHAGDPGVRGFLGRMLPMAAGQALRSGEFDGLGKILPITAKYSDNPQSVYAQFCLALIQHDDPRSVPVLNQTLAMALLDERIADARKQDMMRLIYSTTDSGDASAGGHQVPFVSFSGPSLEDGKEIAISDFKGKVLLVDFWATWCGPCIAKMPEIVKLYDEYKDEGLEVLGVSLDRADQATAIRRTMARHNMTWPQIYSGEAFEGRPAAANNVRAIPTTFLIDRDGRARYTNLRGEALAKRVQELLAERPGQPISSSDSAADRRSTVQTPSTASEALPLRAPGR